jgi:hypothetical protein
MLGKGGAIALGDNAWKACLPLSFLEETQGRYARKNEPPLPMPGNAGVDR